MKKSRKSSPRKSRKSSSRKSSSRKSRKSRKYKSQRMKKTPVRLTDIIRKGTLRRHGYSLSLPAPLRKIAIQQAVVYEGVMPIYKKLILLRTLNKSRPSLFKKLNADATYVKKMYNV